MHYKGIPRPFSGEGQGRAGSPAGREGSVGVSLAFVPSLT